MKPLGLIVLVLTGLVGVAVANEERCKNVATNTFVSDPTDCQGYYLCQNDRAFHDLCPEATWFNEVRQACMKPGDFCTPPPCNGFDRKFVEDTTAGCGNWIYCRDSEVSHSGVCPNGLTFFQDTQVCTYPMCGGTDPTPALAAPIVLD